MNARPANLDMRALLPPKDQRERMIAEWLAEDIGRGDITTDFLIPANARARFVMNTRDDVVVCGVDLALEVIEFHVPEAKCEVLTPDGTRAAPGTALARIEGPATSATASRIVSALMLSSMITSAPASAASFT